MQQPTDEISDLSPSTYPSKLKPGDVSFEHANKVEIRYQYILGGMLLLLIVMIALFPILNFVLGIVDVWVASGREVAGPSAAVRESNDNMFRAVLPFTSAIVGYLAREFVARLRRSEPQ